MRYKLIDNCDYVRDNEDGSLLNKSSEKYIEWLAIPGNTPEPADPPPVTVRTVLASDVVRRLDAIGKLEALNAVLESLPLGKRMLWQKVTLINADPPDEDFTAAMNAAGLTAEEKAVVLAP